jgi:hypothetical protein
MAVHEVMVRALETAQAIVTESFAVGIAVRSGFSVSEVASCSSGKEETKHDERRLVSERMFTHGFRFRLRND